MGGKITSGDSVVATRPLFQEANGGSIPTSPHQFLQVISKRLALSCYKKWHYLGATALISTVDFGVFVNGEIMGAISFGSPNATELDGYFDRYSQEGVWEIKRLALADSLPKNSESHAIAIAIRLLRKTYPVSLVVTYADSGVGHVGTIYKASGFKYLGLTAQKSDFFIDGKIQQRGSTRGKKGEWKPRSRKHLYIKDFR